MAYANACAKWTTTHGTAERREEANRRLGRHPEHDARRGRELGRELGFSATDQIRVATVSSELARNRVSYRTPGGSISLSAPTSPRPGASIAARDKGTGISDLDDVMPELYASRSGMGKGLLGTRQLMASSTIRTGPNGTEILARPLLWLGGGNGRVTG
ncbi:hypothetical protein ACFL5O_07275 [Myxococcota bacterium]